MRLHDAARCCSYEETIAVFRFLDHLLIRDGAEWRMRFLNEVSLHIVTLVKS